MPSDENLTEYIEKGDNFDSLTLWTLSGSKDH